MDQKAIKIGRPYKLEMNGVESLYCKTVQEAIQASLDHEKIHKGDYNIIDLRIDQERIKRK